LLDRLRNAVELPLVEPAGRLHFTDNQLSQLTLGAEMVEQLMGLAARGLFQAAVLQGNVIGAMGSVFASTLLSFDGNSFVAEPRDGVTPYGVMIANRAAAAGNVALQVGDHAILHFITPANGGFSGAANQVFTLPSP